MNSHADIGGAVATVLATQRAAGKPLAIIIAGHNGSGKSTLWRQKLAGIFQIPLVNADRMMLSILPEPAQDNFLPPWAATLRDTDRDWMYVAQKGVESFVGHAMARKVPFAMETVFSHWEQQPDGNIASKIDRIRDIQRAGYFVLLLFVGLTSVELSVLRVRTRVLEGGHGIDEETLRRRFPRTQIAIGQAVPIADAAILTDNSREKNNAFTVCRVQINNGVGFDIRNGRAPLVITNWLDIICPDLSASR